MPSVFVMSVNAAVVLMQIPAGLLKPAFGPYTVIATFLSMVSLQPNTSVVISCGAKLPLVLYLWVMVALEEVYTGVLSPKFQP